MQERVRGVVLSGRYGSEDSVRDRGRVVEFEMSFSYRNIQSVNPL